MRWQPDAETRKAWRHLASLAVGQPFAFVEPAGATGMKTVVRGQVLGPGEQGGVAVALAEGRRTVQTEWSGQIYVLPLREG